MSRVSAAVVSAALLPVFLTGCGASQATPAALAEGAPQPYPLLAGETRVGWVVASHDAREVSLTWLANPGWSLDATSLCASSEAFGWTDPVACGRRVTSPDPRSVTLSIPFGELMPAGADACARVLWFQAQASVTDDRTGTPAGSAYAGAFKARVAMLPSCAPRGEPAGCVRTPHEWAREAAGWPLDGMSLGGATYSNPELAALLAAEAQGDASAALARAAIAARLNIAAGAEPARAADRALEDAERWLSTNRPAGARLPYGVKVTAEGQPNAPGWDDAMNLAALLDRFDTGFAGPARCD